MEDLTDVYNDLIMEHSMNSYNKKKLENADYSEIGHNPNCGDEITLELKLNGDKIEDMAFSGHGCAISQASTSIMIDTLRGKTIEEAKEIIKTFIEMIKREITDEEQLKKLGIECTFVNADDSEEEISKAFRPNTKALFGETISNPSIDVLDIEKFARIAHKHGVPLIVDNTFATPINCRPFEWGADIITHSTTKYMDGHATCVGGVIVDSGNFDWEAQADKFPGLTQPDESYHGLTYTKAFGKMAYITKATAQLMRDLGSIQSPQNAFLLNLGLETLHLRVPRHCQNAQKVAEYLEANDKVAWVNYCGLKSSKYYELAQKYLPNGSCGVIAFGLKGSREDAIKFMDNLKLACIVTHVADARTCVLHPASHTHRQLTDEQLIEAGVAPDLIRLSVGIEDVNDIIADIEQALAKF